MPPPSPASSLLPALATVRSVTLALLLSTALAAPLTAALRWNSTEVSLHLNPEEEIGRAAFAFVNDGDVAVEITSVVPGCGCTAALPTKTHLAPGEKGDIPVEFHRGNREGTFHISISVYTSAADSPATLALNVEIATLVKIEPRFIYWKAGESREPRSVRVELLSPQSAKILDVVCGNPLFTARLAPVGNSDRLFDLVVTPPKSETTFSSITVRAQAGGTKTERIYTLLARTL
jgi:hypothetical protein